MAEPNLIELGWFTSHSGRALPWKIDADAISGESVEAIAQIIRRRLTFSAVIGVPRGGLRLQRLLEPYRQDGPTLIVDDVLTTGKSMEEWRVTVAGPSVGVVIFARGPCPDWVWPIFQVSEWAQL